MDVSHYYGASIKEIRDSLQRSEEKHAELSLKERHALALELWDSGVHDARLLAIEIEHSRYITKVQLDKWIKESDFFDLVDTIVRDLVSKTSYMPEKIEQWTASESPLIRRAGFMTLAELAKSKKKVDDELLADALAVIGRHLAEEHDFVKEAMNYALISIGRRGKELQRMAQDVARMIGRIAISYGGEQKVAPDARAILA